MQPVYKCLAEPKDEMPTKSWKLIIEVNKVQWKPLLFCFFQQLSKSAMTQLTQFSNQVIMNSKLFHALLVLTFLLSSSGNARVRRADRECNVNICFALQGSSVIEASEYEDQKRIAQLVVYLIGESTGYQSYAAVQYAIVNTAISPLTGSRFDFLTSLKRSKQLNGVGSFPTAGLNYCFSELQSQPSGEKVIVFFGNGESTIGSEPSDRSNLFRQTGGRVIAVGVGRNQNIRELFYIANGEKSQVFSLSSRSSLWGVSLALRRLICNA